MVGKITRKIFLKDHSVSNDLSKENEPCCCMCGGKDRQSNITQLVHINFHEVQFVVIF